MAKSKAAKKEINVDRRKTDRRESSDRRQSDAPVAVERRKEPRRKTPRRRQIDPTTCERDYSEAEVEFMNALDAYKRRSGRMFPTCSEILEVFMGLGYRKVTDPALLAATEMISADPLDEGDEADADEFDSLIDE